MFHLGCADWPFTAEMLEKGQLLHQRLEKVSSLLGGLDLSEDAIKLLRRFDVDHVYAGDISELGAVIKDLGWTPEIFVAGEIIEHVDAPGPFLRECARQMPLSSRLIITVPNAFSIKGVLHNTLGYEKVNIDHVAYYSYATLMCLLTRCNLRALEVRYYKDPSARVQERVLDMLLRPLWYLRPYLCGGIIVSCCRAV